MNSTRLKTGCETRNILSFFELFELFRVKFDNKCLIKTRKRSKIGWDTYRFDQSSNWIEFSSWKPAITYNSTTVSGYPDIEARKMVIHLPDCFNIRTLMLKFMDTLYSDLQYEDTKCYSNMKIWQEKYTNTEKNMQFTILQLFYNIAVKCT